MYNVLPCSSVGASVDPDILKARHLGKYLVDFSPNLYMLNYALWVKDGHFKFGGQKSVKSAKGKAIACKLVLRNSD